MLVIGGRQSANTTKLAASCRKINRRTYHVESAKDLKKKFYKDTKTIGIATGASTPPYAIREVVAKIKKYEKSLKKKCENRSGLAGRKFPAA